MRLCSSLLAPLARRGLRLKWQVARPKLPTSPAYVMYRTRTFLRRLYSVAVTYCSYAVFRSLNVQSLATLHRGTAVTFAWYPDQEQ